MNAENFTEYIENPSLLFQMNYEELKQLILQYPYNANLRYLLAKKSQLEGRNDHERNLRNAAIHSPDRMKLFQLLKEEIEAEERLELKQLNELDLNLPETPLEEIVLDTNENASIIPTGVINIEDRLEEENLNSPETPLEEIVPEADENAGIMPTNVRDIEDQLEEEDFNFPTPFDGELDELKEADPNPAPLHRSQFKSWHQRYQKPQKIIVPDADKSNALPEELAQKSIELSDEVASETLAKLLTHQNQDEEAIKVYERLALLFPEKSDFFAEQIESLKNK